LLRQGAEYLATQLAANAAARACHQHGFALGIAVKKQVIGLDGFAAQQVVDVKLAQIIHRDATGCNVTEVRQGTYRQLMCT
jgi:hypothetical protein